jgi:ribosome maturation factor RimP
MPEHAKEKPRARADRVRGDVRAPSPESAAVRPAPALDLAPVIALAEPIARVHGLELVDVEWTTGREGLVLRVTIERPPADAVAEGEMPVISNAAAGDAVAAPLTPGATLEDCVRVSRDLSAALDAADPIAHSYNLEVSSPGLDRPLKGARDFRRHVGRLAKVKLVEPARDGQRVLRGLLLSADEERITMDVDGNLHEVPLTGIAEARLVVELGGGTPPGRRPHPGGAAGRRATGKNRRSKQHR